MNVNEPELIRITRQNAAAFRAKFSGFNKIRMVTYVASPQKIIDLFEKHRLREVEVFIGTNAEDQWKQSLQRDVESLSRLVQLHQSGRLRIYFPRVTDVENHSKLYLLYADGNLLCAEGHVRVIFSSANFTLTALEARKQVNDALIWDLSPSSPVFEKWEKHYESHLADSVMFMEDLAKLLEEDKSTPPEHVLQNWLEGQPTSSVELEVLNIMDTVAEHATNPQAEVESLLRIDLPKAQNARRLATALMTKENLTVTGGQGIVDVRGYAALLEKHHKQPLMRIDMASRQIRINLDGRVVTMTAELPPPSVVDGDLGHLEEYVKSADLGIALDRAAVKLSWYEALLYVLFSPFASQHMEIIRRRSSDWHTRGPRHLVIMGRTLNGKSIFVEFAMRLLTGVRMKPLSGDAVTRGQIRDVAKRSSTCFPIFLDDVPQRRFRDFEGLLKDYWEKNWHAGRTLPAMIMTSNLASLPSWAVSRLKRLDYDVQFEANKNVERLSAILQRPNGLFRYFASLYLEQLEHEPPPEFYRDELSIARLVMKQLYSYAARPMPDFFPDRPVEEIIDVDKARWLRLRQYGKATMDCVGPEIRVQIAPDMLDQVRDYAESLPPNVKHKRMGGLVIIESPETFQNWLGIQLPDGQQSSTQNHMDSPLVAQRPVDSLLQRVWERLRTRLR